MKRVTTALLLMGSGAAAAAGVEFAGTSTQIGEDVVANEDERVWEKYGLPHPNVAQESHAYRSASFLSKEEVVALKDLFEKIGDSGKVGVVERDGEGREVDIGSTSTVWRTVYLHTDLTFQRTFPDLLRRIRREFFVADDEAGWHVLEKYRDPEVLNIRTIEFHQYNEGGSLANWRDEHFDDGSLITIDVMLSEPGRDFEGGELVFPGNNDTLVEAANFGIGDATLFQSHKPHNVRPVRRGRREVLVLELWEGKERDCAHRCVKREGVCANTISRFQLADMARDFANLG